MPPFVSRTSVSLHFDGCLCQVLAMHPIKQKYERQSLPASFDGRMEWRDTLQQVRDQGWYVNSVDQSFLSARDARYLLYGQQVWSFLGLFDGGRSG